MQTLDERTIAHPFLEGLSARHLEMLNNYAMKVEFEAGEPLFHEGDPANRFYLIMEGAVALECDTGEHRPVLIQTLGAGEVLGWSWLLPPYYWHFNAHAVRPTRAVFFYGTRLREECERDHHFGYELMKRTAAVVIQRLQSTRRRLMAARKQE